MYTTTLALAISLAVNLPIASAGPFAYHNHQSSIRTVHRRHRHHAQADVAVVQPAERADVAECDVAARAVTSCENGAWRCEGSQLQRESRFNFTVIPRWSWADKIRLFMGFLACNSKLYWRQRRLLVSSRMFCLPGCPFFFGC